MSSVFAVRGLSSTAATAFTHRTVDTGTAVNSCAMLISVFRWQNKNGEWKDGGVQEDFSVSPETTT